MWKYSDNRSIMPVIFQAKILTIDRSQLPMLWTLGWTKQEVSRHHLGVCEIVMGILSLFFLTCHRLGSQAKSRNGEQIN